jgi:hypothetical protein
MHDKHPGTDETNIDDKPMRTRITHFHRLWFTSLIVLLSGTTGCDKTVTETWEADSLSQWMPLVPGRSVTYRLDSTVYISNNTAKVVRSYIVKDIVESAFTDNTGRKAYRIVRRRRDAKDTLQWNPNAVFTATPTGSSIEWVDNNLRFIRLSMPLRDGFTWKGNSYINTLTDPNLQYLDDWTYKLDSVGKPKTLDGRTFNETLTVNQRNEVINNPGDKSRYFSVTRSRDVYAKGIGLVHREFLHETWQPPNISSTTGYYESNSLGIRLSYIRHE